MRRQISVAEPDLSGNEMRYLQECIRTGWVSARGPMVERFEKAFAAICGVSHAVSTSSGTAALHLVLAALGVGPGDEVIVPVLTYVATANAVVYCGARPVFVDVTSDTWTIDPEQIRPKISPKTRAIIPVHLFGHPAEMEEILRLARRYDLFVIEDAAEAVGTTYRGRPVGSLGTAGCFSFFANKLITTGEGGMVTTNDAFLAAQLRSLRNQAVSLEEPYYHSGLGFNYRMTALQAAVGLGQVERIDHLFARKREIARLYRKYLTGRQGIILPVEEVGSSHAYWMFSIVLTDQYPLSVPELRRRLSQAIIETRPFFVPLSLQPHLRDGQSYPVAERLARQGLMLPSGVKLTEGEINYICEIIHHPDRNP